MQHSPSRVKGLQGILVLKCLEYIIREIHREMCGVRVVRPVLGARSYYVGEELHVLLGKAVCRGFAGGCLEVIEVSRFLLELAELCAHEIQRLDCKFPAFPCFNSIAIEIQESLVHAIEAYCGEMLRVAPEEFPAERHKASLQVPLYNLPFYLEGFLRDFHCIAKLFKEFILIVGEISNARHVDCHNPDASCLD